MVTPPFRSSCGPVPEKHSVTVIGPVIDPSCAGMPAQAASANANRSLRNDIETRRSPGDVPVRCPDLVAGPGGAYREVEDMDSAIRDGEGMLPRGGGDRGEHSGAGIQEEINLSEEIRDHVVESVV